MTARRWIGAVLLATACTAQAQPACRPDPLDGRALYLRGSFNQWASAEAQRLRWACNRWVLVTRIAEGEHRFKIGDEGWSADTDIGAAVDDPTRLATKAQGNRDIARRFPGTTQRITLTMDDRPRLEFETCPLDAPPLGDTRLFLRGSMNNFSALDDYAFQFSCDGYYLNVTLNGRHEFRIADAAGRTSFGRGQGAYLRDGGDPVVHEFTGPQTLRLAWAGGRPELSIGAQTFADPRMPPVTDPTALAITFDSRATTSKSPFGAVVEGTTVDYAVTAGCGGVARLTLVVERRRLEGNQEVLEYTELARVPMTSAADGSNRFTARHRFVEPGVYGYWFDIEMTDGRRWALQNNRDAIHWTREKGSGGAAAIEARPSVLAQVRRLRQTVYARDFQVPAWAADVVYYYVFPERFRNGDPTNDPVPGRDRFEGGTVERHANWLDKPFRPGSGDGSDDRHSNDFFGGDLAGLIDKLDYIKDLGANAIYMTPVFRAPSNHKYDTADYLNIDPAFGRNEDFERLTREAGRRGIRIIPDTSLNHVGSDSMYFDRYGHFRGVGAFANGRVNAASPYAAWFTFDTSQPDPSKQYRGWVGIASLPEIDKSLPAFRDFAYRRSDSVMKLWLDRGAAGWRMDVAPWVPDDFWREWRTEIKRHRPDALTVAEAWFDASKYLVGDMFDSTMNYVFRNAVLEYAAGGPATALMSQLEALREAYPPQVLQAQMNLLSSHDQARALHHFGFRDGVTDPAVIARAKQRLLLAVFLQMSYPGAPTIYYGDEVGVTGGDDPYNRATYPWADLGGKPDTALLREFKALVAMRHAHPVLRRGELTAPLHLDEHVVVMGRRLGDSVALVAMNNADTPRRVRVARPEGWRATQWRDARDGSAATTEDGVVAIEVPALGGRVLLGR